MPRASRPPNLHGLYGRNMPRSVKWACDFDYADKLSDQEKHWLSAFSNRYYGANFSCQAPDGFREWTDSERKAAYIAKNTANADILGKLPEEFWQDPDAAHVQEHAGVREDWDLNPIPEYLASSEYRAALAEYRRHLDPTRKQRNPELTPEYLQALRNLERTRLDEQD